MGSEENGYPTSENGYPTRADEHLTWGEVVLFAAAIGLGLIVFLVMSAAAYKSLF